MREVPSGHTVEVWWFGTRTTALAPADLAYLDAAETQRARSFLFPADRHRFQVAHVRLRQVLAGYTGTAAGDVPLRREPCPRCGGPSGKPVLAPGSVPGPGGARTTPWFSLAHSGDVVVIAVAGHPVGVDVERDATGCVCSLAAGFHPADAAWVAGVAEPARHAAVITCWVRAEAALKCSGEGIAHGLSGFPVRPFRDGCGQEETTCVHGCALRRLAAPAGYRAAVALAGTGQVTPLAATRLPPAP